MQKVNVPKAIVVRISGFGHLACFITFGVTNEFFKVIITCSIKRKKELLTVEIRRKWTVMNNNY